MEPLARRIGLGLAAAIIDFTLMVVVVMPILFLWTVEDALAAGRVVPLFAFEHLVDDESGGLVRSQRCERTLEGPADRCADGVDYDGLWPGAVLSIVGPAVALHGRSPRRSHSTGPL